MKNEQLAIELELIKYRISEMPDEDFLITMYNDELFLMVMRKFGDRFTNARLDHKKWLYTDFVQKLTIQPKWYLLDTKLINLN